MSAVISTLLSLKKQFLSFWKILWKYSILSKNVNCMKSLSLNAFRILFWKPHNKLSRWASARTIFALAKWKLNMPCQSNKWASFPAYLSRGIISLPHSFSASSKAAGALAQHWAKSISSSSGQAHENREIVEARPSPEGIYIVSLMAPHQVNWGGSWTHWGSLQGIHLQDSRGGQVVQPRTAV